MKIVVFLIYLSSWFSALCVWGSSWSFVGSNTDEGCVRFSIDGECWFLTNAVAQATQFSLDQRSCFLQKVSGGFALEVEIDAETITAMQNEHLHIGLILTSSPTNLLAHTVVFALNNNFRLQFLESSTTDDGKTLVMPGDQNPGMQHKLILRYANQRVYASAVCGEQGELSFDFSDVPVDFGDDLFAGLVVFHNGDVGCYNYVVRNLSVRELRDGELDHFSVIPAPPVIWRPDSCLLDKQGGVLQWQSTDGKYVAKVPTNGKARPPTFVTAAENGYACVRFNGVDQVLSVVGQQPINDTPCCTVICVFQCGAQSGMQGTMLKNDYFWCNSYLISSDFSDQEHPLNDFTVAISDDYGAVAGIGLKGHYRASKRLKLPRVTDERPHVVVFRLDEDNRVFRLNVDGVELKSWPLLWQRRGAYPIAFGGDSRCVDTRFFKGDIFEILFFNGRCLTESELSMVGINLAKKYGVVNHAYEVKADASMPPPYISEAITDRFLEITSQPRSCRTLFGQEASFAVRAGGGEELNYLWFEDDQPIPWLTTPEISILTGKNRFISRRYKCRVSNGKGAVFTDEALLEVEYE
ncbi:MAG: immunoglobulin domain-containing protein [Kiritimatiellae bacterium]|nr:immunoglobulin domain-containing protein [Kiritimatiellia bacterium]